VTKLAKFEVLSPLTGADDEWNDVSDGLWQNNRDSAVFKAKDGCYFINAFVWVDKETCGYTNKRVAGILNHFHLSQKLFISM
jgi:hypothetical protein